MADIVGVFGGTFDPPHYAHEVLARNALQQMGLARVLWVPVGQPPHKSDQMIADSNHRIEMVMIVIADEENYRFSSVDIDRPPPHYAYETMELLKSEIGDELIYLMGSDSLRDLLTWEKPERFVSICDGIGVMDRASVLYDLDRLDHLLPGLRDKVSFFEAPMMDISGRTIRERVRYGESISEWVRPEIEGYIQEHQLYRAAPVE